MEDADFYELADAIGCFLEKGGKFVFVIIVYVFEIKMDSEGGLVFLLVAGSHILHSETTTKLLID